MQKMKNKIHWFAAAFLFLIVFQCISSISVKNATYDEVVFIVAGDTYLKTGDTSWDQEVPPLIEYFIGIPLLFKNPNLLDKSDLRTSLYKPNINADKIIFWARIPIVLLSVLLGFYVFVWGKELYGSVGGLFALFLYAFNPNILAHSRLATTDIGVTFFMFIAIYYFWKFINQPTKKSMITSGTTLGLALLCKFTAVLLLPIFFLLTLAAILYKEEANISFFPHINFLSNKEFLKKTYLFSLALLLIFSVSLLILNIGYGFQGSFKSIDEYSQQDKINEHMVRLSKINSKAYKVVDFIDEIPLPFPSSYVKGFGLHIVKQEAGFPAFLMGNYSDTGWWYYFIISFLIKNPIPLLIFISTSFVIWIKKERFFDDYFLLVPIFIVFFYFSFLNKVDAGIRHILPVFPFIFVFMGKIVTIKWERGIILLLFGFCLWYVFSAIAIYPHYLAYFNELADGPDNGYTYLVDSNLDWGQDLKGLKVYMDEHNIDEIKLSYSGTADPSYYNITHEKLSYFFWNLSCTPTTGIIAISVNNLQGVHFKNKTCFAWLKEFEPIDKIGYSIFIYEIKADDLRFNMPTD